MRRQVLHRLLFAVIYFVLTKNLGLVQQIINLFKKLIPFDSIDRKRGYANTDGNPMTGKIRTLPPFHSRFFPEAVLPPELPALGEFPEEER